MSEYIDVNKIRTDGGTQTRAGLSSSTLAEYALLLAESGGEWPFKDPIELFYDGHDYWLADGFHRVAACKQQARHTALANINQGTQRDAVLFSVGANADHGLPRSHEDKRRAVTRLLEDSEWSNWADREIARRCKTSAPFVGRLRKELTVNVYSDEPVERTYVRNGKVATMNTAGIGSTSTRKQDNEFGLTIKQQQENMNDAALNWLRHYKDDTGREWHDLTDTQTHHANAPCYQAFTRAFPSLYADHKFSLKQARAILKREQENQAADEKVASIIGKQLLNIGQLREMAIVWKGENWELGFLSGFIDYLDRNNKQYVLSAAQDAYQEALTVLRHRNGEVMALVKSIEILDKELAARMGTAVRIYEKDEPKEVVQVWRALGRLLEVFGGQS